MKTIRAHLLLLGLTLLLCSIVYPLGMLLIGWAAFPRQAMGSLIEDEDGKVVGSRLVAQRFSGDQWFWPRPSPCDYNPSAAGGSNWGPSNPELRKRAVEIVSKRGGQATTDAVTASGSGLGPHITLRNATQQLPRVAKAWAKRSKLSEEDARKKAERVLNENAFTPPGGEPIVNVLEVNIELRRNMRRKVSAGPVG